MARIRTVKPELFKHEVLYEAEKQYKFPLRLAFIGLFSACDREGRFKWRPRELKLDILPYDDVDFNLVLNAFLTIGLIKAYEDERGVYGFIPTWNNHQVINNRERQSVLPEPQPPYLRNVCFTGGARVIDASSTPLLLARGEGKGKEGNGKEHIRKVSNETSLLASNQGLETANTQRNYLSEIKEVFQYWQEKMNHPRSKLDKSRLRKIQGAIKLGFNVEQLKQAIDGCANTPFNMGENSNKQRYDSIDLIFRDAEHIERFIRNAGGNEMEHAVSQIDQISEGAI